MKSCTRACTLHRKTQELEQQLAQARATVAAEAGRLERHFAAAQEQERAQSCEAAERLQKVRRSARGARSVCLVSLAPIPSQLPALASHIHCLPLTLCQLPTPKPSLNPLPLNPPHPPPPQLLDAQSELEAVKGAAAEREGELREQIGRLRREKREMEARAAGVDLGATQVAGCA